MSTQAVHQDVFMRAPSGNLVVLTLEYSPEGHHRIFAPQGRDKPGQVEALQVLEEIKASFEKAGIPHYCFEVNMHDGRSPVDSISIGERK